MIKSMKTFLKALGSGVLFWAIMFSLVSACLDWYNQYELAKVSIAISSGVVAILLVYFLRVEKIKPAIVFSLTWLAVGLVLDYFVTTRFNSQIFASVYLWLGYGLMFISPLLYVKLKDKKSVWKK
jgi:uncharacterized membrane protein YjjP (DUF1212 family)